MIHVDFNLTEKCCTIIPRDKNHLSIQSGFFSVQNCMKCCGRRQEKFMMPSLPLKNLQLPCGNQTHTHIHTHTHLQNNRTLNCLALTRMAIGSSSLVFEATCREALWDSRGLQVGSPAHLSQSLTLLFNGVYDLEQLFSCCF